MKQTFDKVFEKAWFKLRPFHRIADSNRRCRNQRIALRKNGVIGEMNTKVFPVPKKLLSELIKACYENDWKYVYEYPFITVYNWMKESENAGLCRIDWKKMDGYRTYSLLFICLPYNLKTWKDELAGYFNEETIESLFLQFHNQNGASGTYSGGQLVIVNSDAVDLVKDCAEIVEHELVHMIEDVDGAENTMSPSMKWILDSPNEVKTYTVNLVNNLFTLYDHKQTMFTAEADTYESRRKFLDDLLESAENNNIFENFYGQYEKYANSRLTKGNLLFLWQLFQWRPEELEGIVRKIYDEFLEP